jgi:hypothetical protein
LKPALPLVPFPSRKKIELERLDSLTGVGSAAAELTARAVVARRKNVMWFFMFKRP